MGCFPSNQMQMERVCSLLWVVKHDSRDDYG
jgi:hypothetical protein